MDTVALKLNDYMTIIKQPMDLGTAKVKLNANEYKSPQESASDIRLTFKNAMTYNPTGHEVHIMAEQMLHFFYDWWKPICDRYEEELGSYLDVREVDLQEIKHIFNGEKSNIRRQSSARFSRANNSSIENENADRN